MHINCSDSNLNSEILELAHNLYDFMRNEFSFECEPKVHFVADPNNAKNILGRTGHYDPEKEEITVYISDRHGKDILRSFAHELMHHIQGCEGMMDSRDMSATSDPNYIMHDDFLKFLEADAFKRGNICFRKWEATLKGKLTMNESKTLDEKKKKKKKFSKAKLKMAHKKAKKALKKGGFEKYGADAERVAYATMAKQELKEGIEDKMSKENEQPEVKVNEALKNSHYYIPSDRGAPEAYAAREEKIYNELLRKFKIKK